MFWNKKENNKGLPDLPPLKTPMKSGFELPDSEEESQPVPLGLPSFPDNPIQNLFPTGSKDDLEEDHLSDSHEESPSPETHKIRTMEMEEWTPKEKSSVLEEPPEQPAQQPFYAPQQRKRDEKQGNEVFVKIEKFNSARRALNSIKQKLEDVDVLLKKVRETKMREEQELTSWEKELSAIKARIQDVNSNIFE